MRANGSFTLFNPPEAEPLAFDFTSQLPAGATVASVVGWKCKVMTGGVDPNAQSLLTGDAQLDGNITIQNFDSASAIPGIEYAIAALVTPSTGSGPLLLWAPLPVKEYGTP